MRKSRNKARRTRQNALARICCALLALWMCCMPLQLAAPTAAYAMSTSKLTATPNGDSSNDVLGGKTTRITWEGYPDADEVVTALSITLPDDTSFDLSRVEATLLTGSDGLTRVAETGEVTSEGQTIRVKLSDPQPAAGGYLRLALSGIVFPTAGGEQHFSGSYTLSDGHVVELTDMPTVTVKEVTWSSAAASWLEEQPWVEAWNSVPFLQLFFNPVIAVRSLPAVFGGFIMALAVVVLSFPCAIPIGLALALMRMAKGRLPRVIASVYVNVVRGTPLFLQIYIIFFGLPMAGIDLPKYVMAVLVLSLNSGAYLCEIFRAGIQSIPKGQTEASRSLGMNGAQTMMFVIIPQTIRRVIPTMTSEFILLFKDTSLLASVGYMEIIMYAKSIVASTGSITPYIVAACFYLLITLPLTKLVSTLEQRLAGSEGGVSVRKKVKKQRKSKAKASAQGIASDGGGSDELEGVLVDAAPDSPEASDAVAKAAADGSRAACAASSANAREN